MHRYDMIIVGAGAAGLFLAANIQDRKILIIEKMDAPGKKILITGGGMCNLTNTDETDEFLSHFREKGQRNFLKPALMNFSTAYAQQWFNRNGLPTVVRDDGKVFPRSLKAFTVVDLLRKKAEEHGVEFLYVEAVLAIGNTDGVFSIETPKGLYQSGALVITTGGKSYENTGSDGSGYVLAKSLGHTVVEPTQALVGIHITDSPFISLSGNAVRGSLVEFYHEGESRRYLQDQGDLLFTHKGVSGPVILNNSRFIKPKDQLVISLIPSDNKERSREDLIRALTAEPNRQVSTILKSQGLFAKLIDILLKETGIPADLPCSQLNKKKRKRLITLVLEYPITVSRKGYFSSAMVTAGGISLSEVNRKTMESKIVPSLYFAGEVLDIDGDTGGYNLQAAWATAKLIADHVNK